MRLLFYVEPVIYRSNPSLLANWINIINKAVACSGGGIEAHLASSDTLIGYADLAMITPWPLPSMPLLESVGFDRVAYMRDVCAGDGHINAALVDHLSLIRSAVEPDVVISWTENAYVRRVFDASEIFFTELGPVPRTGFVDTIHLDPFGHQVTSVFDQYGAPRWHEHEGDSAISAWYDHWTDRIDAASRSIHLSEWLASLPSGRNRKLVALQPNDWLTYEGTGVATDPLFLLAAVASAARAEDLLIPQWHPGQAPPSEDLLAVICREYPALAIPPPELRVGHSECFLPEVEEVITVSSNVALAAALLGRRVQVLGQSKFSALSTPPEQSPLRRSDLIPVLASKLCRPLRSWTEEPHGFVEHLQSVIDWRDSVSARPEFSVTHVARLAN